MLFSEDFLAAKKNSSKMDRKSIYTLGVIFFIILQGKFNFLLKIPLNTVSMESEVAERKVERKKHRRERNGFLRETLHVPFQLRPNSQVHMVELTILS